MASKLPRTLGQYIKPNGQRLGDSSKQTMIHCYWCGLNNHKVTNDKCPVHNKTCQKRGKLGHFKSCCRSQLQVNNIEKSGEVFDLYTTDLESDVSTNLDALSCEVSINGTHVYALIDTGSQVNILPCNMVPNLKLVNSKAKVSAWGGFDIPIKGQAEVTVVYRNLSVLTIFQIVEADKTNCHVRPLLSYGLYCKLGLIREPTELRGSDNILAVNSVEESKIRMDFTELFQGFGALNTGDAYSITLAEETKSYSPPARRMPPAILPKVKQELDQIVANGIIRPIEELTQLCSPMVVAYCKSGKVRIVTDFRKLNKNVKHEEFQIPTVEELATRAKGSKWFSKCDLKSGFWQIPIASESEQYLSFSTPFGCYCY